MKKTRVNLALIGAGPQGLDHLIAAVQTENTNFTCVAESNSIRAKTVAKQYPDLRVYSNYKELIATETVDGIVIALPHHLYAEIWRDLLSYRLPILKEKPLARNLTEAHRFLSSAQNAGCAVVTAIQRREHPSYCYLKQQIHEDVVRTATATYHLGRDPTVISAEWRGDGVKSGGGALLDCGYHMIDLMTYLVGPMEVVACNLWALNTPCTRHTVETEVSVLCRSGTSWVNIDSQVGGKQTADGKYQKFECVELETNECVWQADRQFVFRDGIKVFSCERTWDNAMTRQLDEFADRINTNQFDDNIVWEQLAIMQVIESAYHLAESLGPVNEGDTS